MVRLAEQHRGLANVKSEHPDVHGSDVGAHRRVVLAARQVVSALDELYAMSPMWARKVSKE